MKTNTTDILEGPDQYGNRWLRNPIPFSVEYDSQINSLFDAVGNSAIGAVCARTNQLLLIGMDSDSLEQSINSSDVDLFVIHFHPRPGDFSLNLELG